MKRVDFLLMVFLACCFEASIYYGYSDPREVVHAAILLWLLTASMAWAKSVVADDWKAIAKQLDGYAAAERRKRRAAKWAGRG